MADAQKTFDFLIRTNAELTGIKNTRKEVEEVREEMAAAGLDTEALDAEIAKLNKSYGEKHTEVYTEHLREQIAATKAAGQDASVLEQRLKGVEAATRKAGGEAESFAGIFKGAFAANLATGAVQRARAEIEQLGQRALDLADRLDDLGTKSGQSVEALQLIGNAASQDGASLENVAEGLNNLQRARSAAIEGNKKLEKTFADLGATQEELTNLSPEELFLKLSDGVANADDRGKALNDTLAILGKSGRSLFGTMEKGSQNIRALSQSMGILSGTSVSALAGAKEQLEQLMNSATVFAGKQITAAMIAGEQFKEKFKDDWLGTLTQPMGAAKDLVLDFAAAQDKAGAALEEMGKKVPNASAPLTEFIEKLQEAKDIAAELIDQNARLTGAKNDQEQQRIEGLVKSGLITPEEGSRQKEQASIDAERQALLRQREEAQRAINREFGTRMGLEGERNKPGADTEGIDKQIKDIDREIRSQTTSRDEASIRLKTNADRQAALRNETARAEQEADRKRREEIGDDRPVSLFPRGPSRPERPLRPDRIGDETGDRTRELEEEARKSAEESQRLSGNLGATIDYLKEQNRMLAETNRKMETALNQMKTSRA